MKTSILAVFISISFISCQSNTVVSSEANMTTPISDSVLESAVIYEVNIRQYSKQGTFEAFTKDIPSLKDLGVKIIWLMPINPI
jgi:alpha-amylase